MATVKFSPKKAAMSRTQIIEYLQEELDVMIETGEVDDDLTIDKKKVTDKVCQRFVDAMYQIEQDGIDLDEEDIVSEKLMYVEGLLYRIKK